MYKIRRVIIMLFILLLCTSQAYANLVLKILVVNPSQTQKKTVPIKAHLPAEVRPEHVVDRQDLEIAYDTEKGTYYVYNSYELEPGETLTREVEIEDIWQIPEAELDSIREETEQLAKVMEKTEFYERADFLRNSIESKLNEIAFRQQHTAITPDAHISAYRETQKLLEGAKSDLVAIKTLLGKTTPISPASTWRMIIMIVAFLGVLGVGYFIAWQRQVKFFPRPKEEPTSAEEAGLSKYEVGKKEKKVGIEDIERRLKEGE